MIDFLQERRRKLDSFRTEGYRAMKLNQPNEEEGFFSRIAKIFMCRPAVVDEIYEKIQAPGTNEIVS